MAERASSVICSRSSRSALRPLTFLASLFSSTMIDNLIEPRRADSGNHHRLLPVAPQYLHGTCLRDAAQVPSDQRAERDRSTAPPLKVEGSTTSCGISK